MCLLLEIVTGLILVISIPNIHIALSYHPWIRTFKFSFIIFFDIKEQVKSLEQKMNDKASEFKLKINEIELFKQKMNMQMKATEKRMNQNIRLYS